MKPADRKRLEIWITNRMHEEQADEAPLRLFKISHLVEGAMKKATILEIPYRDQTEAATIAAQLADHAQQDADAAGGTQKYEIKAQYGNNTVETRGGRFAFRLKGEADDDESDEMGLSSVEVSGRGFAAQQMKHNELLIKANGMMVGELFGAMNAMMHSLTARVEKAETGRSAALELLERMASERMDREIRAAEMQRKAKREEMLMEGIKQVVMPKIMAQFATTDTKIEALLGSMDDKQLETIGNVLRDDQIPMFIAAATEIEAKKAKMEAAKKAGEAQSKAMVERAEGADGSTTLDRILVKDKTLAEETGARPMSNPTENKPAEGT